jgi:site-specific DNA-methyltransferase (adenine-specific)
MAEKAETMHTKIDLQQMTLDQGLESIFGKEWDSIIVSSWFTPEDLLSPTPGRGRLEDSTIRLLCESAKSLRVGGLIFIYGAPHRLPAYSSVFEGLRTDEWRFEFKYWIGAQLNSEENHRRMRAAHVGILLFEKVSAVGSTLFSINNSVRVPHAYCPACGKNVRDWGGKKHLMNPDGSALSDVWTDLQWRPLAGNRMPGDVFMRVSALASGTGDRIVHVIESQPSEVVPVGRQARISTPAPACEEPSMPLPIDSVVEADCLSFMEGLLPQYENKAFDLIFADPPYNLDKLYTNYRDAHATEQYLEWCDRWLKLCARLLKPGGSMFVLNLPKWALHNARTLDEMLEFRHWIVWQALAEPRGKLLPAHYALLYYTKPGETPVVKSSERGCSEPLWLVDSPEYCLRGGCLKKRKGKGDDKKVPLTDIWWDIFRIRHKRDRDYHPCQLPERLLERILMLYSNPDQVVFDPLGGVGTTAVVAKRLNRRFVTTEIDPDYVEIIRKKLAQMEMNELHTGECVVPRQPTRREKRQVTKKHIESIVQQLALDLGRMPELEDVRMADPEVYEHIRKIYENPRKALGAARVALNAESTDADD